MVTDDFGRMDIELLASLCKQETEKFLRWLAHEAGYCFELLCRACRDHHPIALHHVYATYVPLLTERARRHPAFPQSCQDADLFAHSALANFYHAVKGEKFLKKFTALAQAMAYMNVCVHTVILEDVRDFPDSELPPDDRIQSPPTASDLEFEELWAHICSLLADAKDQQLANLHFVLAMKPAEIAQRYPDLWQTPRDVSVALYRIRRLLGNDPYLRSLRGSDE